MDTAADDTAPEARGERVISYWSATEGEGALGARELDEALTDASEWYNEGEVTPGTMRTVYGYAELLLPDVDAVCRAFCPLDQLLERLDDEYAAESCYSRPTAAMKEAERLFVQAVMSEYGPDTYEVVRVVEIDFYAWCMKNEPQLCAPQSPDPQE